MTRNSDISSTSHKKSDNAHTNTSSPWSRGNAAYFPPDLAASFGARLILVQGGVALFVVVGAIISKIMGWM